MPVDLLKFSNLTGAIPYDNLEDAEAVVENLCSENLAVIVTNKATNIVHGTHSHNSYEFVLSYTKMPSSPIDNKIYDRKENTMFAINPMQEHGITTDIKGFNVCGIHFDKSFLQGIAEDIYGSPNIVFTNDSYTVNHDISMLIRMFLEEMKYKQPGYEYMVENLSLLVAGNLVRQIRHNLLSKPHNTPRGVNENLKKVIDYMNENYTNGVSCEDLSELVNIDKYRFIRSFKAQTSKTPYEYLLDLKLEKAKKMLKMKNYSITEISMLCGFSSHSHFTSTFRKKTGMSPTEYRMEP